VKTTFWEVVSRPDYLPIVALLPGLAILFCWWLREARRNDALEMEGGLEAVADDMRGAVSSPERSLGQEDVERVHTWPYLLRIELLVTLAVLIGLTIWSITVDAPLEQHADPNRTPNPSKAPWYFLGLQEMLVYFDAWIAGVVLPCLIILGLCAIPYLDPNPRGDGYYCWRPRRFALTTFWFGMFLWVILIVIGTFFRGPGWNWFWPWEIWDPNHFVDATGRNWADVLGVHGRTAASVVGGVTVFAYYGLGWLAWLRYRRSRTVRAMGPLRFGIVAFLWLTMLALPLKIALRLAFDVHYVWTTPWFNV
jgi:hypothetical protein